MNERMTNALMWFRRKTAEYAEKSGNLWELLEVMGRETYEKCVAFYHEKYQKYEEGETAIEKFLEFDGAENDILFPLMDLPTPEEWEQIKVKAEEAYNLYRKEMP